MISGRTTLIAHIGYPTETFKAPLIYNPYFEKAGIDAVVVPMGVKAKDYRDFLRSIFRLTNIRGALVTMPHKVTTVGLLDECSTAVKVAGSCNAILRRADGTLLGDMFDGAGFARGLNSTCWIPIDNLSTTTRASSATRGAFYRDVPFGRRRERE